MKRYRILMLIMPLVISTTCATAADWIPPDKPNPQAILQEAQADARAKRYKVALAKHVWFHENAIKITPGMAGVRLSFALTYWKNLGKDYPPALKTLRLIRDELETKANAGDDLGNGFQDLAAINRTLEEDSKTTKAFKNLDEKNPEAAKKAFTFAKPALIKDKEYALYSKYVEPSKDFLRMKQLLETNMEMAKDPKFGTQLLDHAKKSFGHGTATLVAVLSVSDRKAEAIEIATLAKKELDDAKFHDELESALAGTIPAPWP